MRCQNQLPESVGGRNDRRASPRATKPLAQHGNQALCGIACITLLDAAMFQRVSFVLGDVVLVQRPKDKRQAQCFMSGERQREADQKFFTKDPAHRAKNPARFFIYHGVSQPFTEVKPTPPPPGLLSYRQRSLLTHSNPDHWCQSCPSPSLAKASPVA